MIYQATNAAWPVLSILQLLPLLTGLLLLRLRNMSNFIIASLASVTQILLAVWLYQHFDSSQSGEIMQQVEQFKLWGALQYHAGVDGISVLFVMLTTLLGFLCVVFMLFRGQHKTAMPAIVMLLQSSMLSQFVTLDLLWFSLMSVAEIALLSLLSSRWPTSDDVLPALLRFMHFMATGLVLLFAGTLILGWHYADMNGHWSFDLLKLAELRLETPVNVLVFFSLFYALGIRIPVFPFHGWLPDFIKSGNLAVAPVYLLGLKVGVYGLVRFVLPLTPQATWHWHWVAVTFAVIGVFYAALLALRQKNLRSLLAYAVVSHTGILTIGLFSLDEVGLKGSILMALNMGLAISGLLFMSGLVWQRTCTTNLNRLGSMFDTLPLVGIAFFISALAIVGMPGTPGFDAVHFVLEGSIPAFGAPITIAAAIGNLIAAAFMLRAFQQIFLSEPQGHTKHWDISPSHLTEKVLAITMIGIIVIVGFYTAPWLALIEKPTAALGEMFYPIAHADHVTRTH